MNDSNPNTYRFAFRGDGGALFGIWIVNLLLAILTLGVYYPWARTRERRFLWASIEFDSEPFVYHGTGLELFTGYLKAAGLLAALIIQMVIWIAVLGDETGGVVGAVILYAAFLGLLPFAIFGAARYRLSRTSYRGVRFSLRGSTGGFARIFFRDAILTTVTLGIYLPHLLANLREYITRNAYYGNTRFHYDGSTGDFFGRYFLLGWLLLPPTLGITGFWAKALFHNYTWNRTTLQGARFDATLDGASLFLLAFTNALLVIFTLGLATPWAQVREYRYYAANLLARGKIDFAAIRQEAQAAGAAGEGVSELLDGGDIDIGLGI